MLDQSQVDELRQRLSDRFTAAELCEILNVQVFDFVDQFLDEVLNTNWDELL